MAISTTLLFSFMPILVSILHRHDPLFTHVCCLVTVESAPPSESDLWFEASLTTTGVDVNVRSLDLHSAPNGAVQKSEASGVSSAEGEASAAFGRWVRPAPPSPVEEAQGSPSDESPIRTGKTGARWSTSQVRARCRDEMCVGEQIEKTPVDWSEVSQSARIFAHTISASCNALLEQFGSSRLQKEGMCAQ